MTFDLTVDVGVEPAFAGFLHIELAAGLDLEIAVEPGRLLQGGGSDLTARGQKLLGYLLWMEETIYYQFIFMRISNKGVAEGRR